MIISFQSQQRALDAVLEAFGVLAHPVIIPVISPTWVLSSVVRAGALPIIVDVAEDLSVRVDSILEDLPSAIICLYSPNGCPSVPKVGTTTIAIANCLPLIKSDAVVAIFSAQDQLGLVDTEFTDLQKDLICIKTGALGIGDYSTWVQDSKVLEKYKLKCSLMHKMYERLLPQDLEQQELGWYQAVLPSLPKVKHAFKLSCLTDNTEVTDAIDIPGEFPVARSLNRIFLPCFSSLTELEMEEILRLKDKSHAV